MRKDNYISPIGYIGYQILYSIPVIGFIFLIVFSCDKTNINRRNFALKYWIELLITVIIAVVAVLIIYFTLGFDTIADMWAQIQQYYGQSAAQ